MDNELELEKRLDLIRQYAYHFICVNGGLSTIGSSLFGKKIFIYEDGKYNIKLCENGYHLRGYSDDNEVYLFEENKIINYVYPNVEPIAIITKKGEFDADGNIITEDNNRYFELEKFKIMLVVLLKRKAKEERNSICDFETSEEEKKYILKNSQIIRDLFYSKEMQIKMEQEKQRILSKYMDVLKKIYDFDILDDMEPEDKSDTKVIPLIKKKK